MQTGYLIAISDFCSSHEIDMSFVHSLEDIGLIKTIVNEDSLFIDSEQLPLLEKFVHLHYDLEINMEGVESIHYLLNKITAMHAEIQDLRNRLRLYESFE